MTKFLICVPLAALFLFFVPCLGFEFALGSTMLDGIECRFYRGFSINHTALRYGYMGLAIEDARKHPPAGFQFDEFLRPPASWSFAYPWWKLTKWLGVISIPTWPVPLAIAVVLLERLRRSLPPD